MIRFENISKKYKTKTVLKSISMTISKGELVTIIGESGCGKTTLLKMVNRLIKPTSGKIFIDDKNIREMDVIQLRRNIGYVIQQTGLFTHMTIQQNIEMIPKLQKVDKEQLIKNTYRLMNLVGLKPEEYLHRYPSELSGGQLQRVGVARAFATDAEIILMDEPFSALDPITREELQDELVKLQYQLKKTIVFVTHDMDEAVKIADKICIMQDGNILQYDTPENILRMPADEYVSSFIGKNRIWSSPEFIQVQDIMITKPVKAQKNLPVFRCIEKMRGKKVDSLLIVEEETNRLEGILKAKHVRLIEDRSQPAKQVMQKEFDCLLPTDSILDALKIVNEKHTSTIPIADEDHILVGMLTKSSLVTTLSEQYFDVEED